MERGGFSVQHPQHLKPPSLHSSLRGGGGVTSAACFLCESLNDPDWSRHNPPTAALPRHYCTQAHMDCSNGQTIMVFLLADADL